MSDAATQHRERAARFAAVIEGVTDWAAPTPVKEWTARDVVAHLTSWFPEFLAAGGVSIPAGRPDDPRGSWARQTAAVQRLLDNPETAEAEFTHPYVGTQSLAAAVSNFYTADVFMHTWDLARASGQDDTLDEAECAEVLAGMQQMAPVIRASGQFGDQQPVADDASAQEKLIAFIGRDPHWSR